MTQRQPAPFGTWRSPITSELAAQSVLGLSQAALDGDDIYWLESRPSEGGRSVLVRCTPNGETTDVTPPPFSVRNRVHEMGGGAYTVHDGVAYFSNFTDGRIYGTSMQSGDAPTPLTPDGADLRYADLTVDQPRQRLICVREDHRTAEPENRLVAISLDRGGEGVVLAAGHDFFASPRLSPDGARLAWITWDYPHMPWDGSELWVADIQPDGLLSAPTLVAGGPEESIFQPEWSPAGVLHFVSDRSGYWNLYRSYGGLVQPLAEVSAEFGVPQWNLGLSTYAFESPGRIICSFTYESAWHLGVLLTSTGQLDPIPLPFSTYSFVCARPGRVVCVASSPTHSNRVIQIGMGTRRVQVLRASADLEVGAAYLSAPQPIEAHGTDDQHIYGLFYPPVNPDFAPLEGERPPAIIRAHGGPTYAAAPAFSPVTQYWTSRGFAVVDVNYAGSTGFGRAYRERLRGQWGVVDVEDCVQAAQRLVEQGLVDGDRLIISGASSGGYTALCALAFHDRFRAGAIFWGIGDLEAYLDETSKFNRRYLDVLVGPYPDQRDRYRERSPIRAADRISVPVFFVHGLNDTVVPPGQTERFVQALQQHAVLAVYLPLPGERHGIRQLQHITAALDAEADFYARVFGLTAALG